MSAGMLVPDPGTELPIAGGVFLAVVGPSGVGKDSILNHARRRLASEPGVVFVRRVITRASDAANEEHDTLSDAEFDAARAAGAFILSWRSHGLQYGIPAATDDAVRAGAVAIANLSRGVVAMARQRYGNCVVVEVTAAADVLRRRLSERGRETEVDVLRRLARNADYDPRALQAETLENNGSLEEAGEAFVALVLSRLQGLGRHNC